MTTRIIAVTGIDGSGKTTLTDWLRQELERRGYSPGFVWSRFNNYLSLPFLAVTRLTGHNVYHCHAGVKMGFHNFQALPLFMRAIFVGLQVIDVNIATLLKINMATRQKPVSICERGPWDTLVDVAADTALDRLAGPFFLRLFCGQIAANTEIMLIDREVELIERSRPELQYDTTLRDRQRLYRRLAAVAHWKVLDNNGDLSETKKNLEKWLDDKGY